jgi:hypothetical protein
VIKEEKDEHRVEGFKSKNTSDRGYPVVPGDISGVLPVISSDVKLNYFFAICGHIVNRFVANRQTSVSFIMVAGSYKVFTDEIGNLAREGKVNWDIFTLLEVVLDQVIVVVDVYVAVGVHKLQVPICLVKSFYITLFGTLIGLRTDTCKKSNSKVVKLI